MFSAPKLTVILFTIISCFAYSVEPAGAIVGGEATTIAEHPWMVGIALAGEKNGYYAQFCGGTLIAPDWVLTAAHCTLDEENQGFTAAELDVIVGRTSLSSSKGERISITRIVRHAGFELLTYNNDIALLQLSKAVNVPAIALGLAPLEFSESLLTSKPGFQRDGSVAELGAELEAELEAKVPIRQYRSTPSRPTGIILGWGVTDEGQGASTLQKARLPLTARTTCQNAYTDYGIILTESMICAGFSLGGIDSCVGDSGGPLIVSRNGQFEQIGLVSWGLECGGVGLYGVYTDVSKYRGWVNFQISYYQ